jgi:hypothetical protein
MLRLNCENQLKGFFVSKGLKFFFKKKVFLNIQSVIH